MTAAHYWTLLRVFLSPVFFIVYMLPDWFSLPSLLSPIILFLLFGAIEISDLIDGYTARKMNQVSDSGKLLDPFADSVSRLTYFLCFTVSGIIPAWVFLLLLYRDLGVAFIRLSISRKGIVMGARVSGKVKATVYAIGGFAGLVSYSFRNMPVFHKYTTQADPVIFTIYLIISAVAVWSLIDYGLAYFSSPRVSKKPHANNR